MISGPVDLDLTFQVKSILPCPDCRATGRIRAQGVLTSLRCVKCDGEGFLTARYYRKLIIAQRLAHLALREGLAR